MTDKRPTIYPKLTMRLNQIQIDELKVLKKQKKMTYKGMIDELIKRMRGIN